MITGNYLDYQISQLQEIVLMISTDPPAQDQYNFVRTSQFYSFYLELNKNKFNNLIPTSKLKFSFRGLIKNIVNCLM